ncbi:hypothetical protein BDN70DRAFT_874116 [Pholiota conissans]|uniref:Uncharacterized protein n=1 Tax=Pholiota conissans TaxID=109636 RepID=A0A9P5ZAP2_9AGAR|nr:hypothetical protein BDN70DRAFT_874116 [Pholiota conissans]
MTDKEIDKAATSSPKFDAGSFFLYEMDPEATEDNAVINTPFVGSVARITPNAVAKYCSSTGQLELLSANLVLKNTSIPVPQYDRLATSVSTYYLVQEYIPGRTVWSVWAGLNW